MENNVMGRFARISPRTMAMPSPTTGRNEKNAIHAPQVTQPVARHRTGGIAQRGGSDRAHGVQPHLDERDEEGFGTEREDAPGKEGGEEHPHVPIV